MTTQDRVAIVGVGHVGSTTAYALMLRGLFSEIVLIDADEALAEAEAADLSDANALARPARIWAGGYADAAAARIAVITAGAATHGKQSRLSVASQSADIVAACARQLVEAGFDGVMVVAANPVDLMALVAHRASGLPAARVVGTGTLLDSSRLQQALASRLGVAASAVEAWVLGEHGDSEVAVFSTVRIGGVSLERFTEMTGALDLAAIAREVREAGYAIALGKGYTSYGVATSAVRICEAIVRDENAVLPVSTQIAGAYGVTDIFLSLPCVLGAGGVARILTPELTPDEEAALVASAETLKAALAGLDGRAAA